MLAFVNFEMPSSDATGLKALARTNGGPIHDALEASLADLLYNLYVGMELVAELFGGIIPTDIQGMYWSGLQGLSTASDTPYYHTVEDVPARIDLPFLASAVIRHTRALDLLDAAPIEAFAAHDPEVWRLEVLSGAAPPDLALSVTARDGAGVAVPGAIIRVTVDVDDFTHAHADSAVADENGRATFTVPAAALAAGAGSRWLHVTAGETYPLAEKIIPLD